MDKCYGNLRDYLCWLDESDYVKKTSMDEIVHCDELWCTILNDNGTITTFEMFNHSSVKMDDYDANRWTCMHETNLDSYWPN